MCHVAEVVCHRVGRVAHHLQIVRACFLEFHIPRLSFRDKLIELLLVLTGSCRKRRWDKVWASLSTCCPAGHVNVLEDILLELQLQCIHLVSEVVLLSG